MAIKQDSSPKDLQKFFASVKRQINLDRKLVKREKTLPPEQIRLGLLKGSHEDNSSFSIDDLKRFQKKIDQTTKKNGREKGVSVDQLLSVSRPDDIQRANGTYISKPGQWNGSLKRGAARLYQVNGGVLQFSVLASSESKKTVHQVRIRLEAWNDQILNTRANPQTAAKNAVNGLVSVDCNCERHQFWYRYLAGIGGYAITPPLEKDFPKIKNPRLKGACCKHVIAAFQVLKTPTYLVIISGHIKKQREKTGFGDSRQARNLTKEETRALTKSRPQKTNIDKVNKRLAIAEKAIKRKLSTLSRKETAFYKKEIKALKAREKKSTARASLAEKALKTLENDAIKLKGALMIAAKEVAKGSNESTEDAYKRLQGLLK